MKIEFTKDWCLRMAELEAQCTSDFTVGTELPAERSDASLESDTSNIGPNIVFRTLCSAHAEKEPSHA